MKTLALIITFFTPLIIAHANESVPTVEVTARVIEAPKDFLFPGSEDGYKTVKPHKAHVSVIEIMTPKELAGLKISFYHIPPLKGQTLWDEVNSIIQFSIDSASLGKLYPQNSPKHTSKIPYSYNIKGKVTLVAKSKNQNK